DGGHGGASADAHESGQIIGGLRQPRRGAGRYRQRRESAGARGEAGGGGKIVAGGDARALADPGGIEERTGPARIFGMPVEDERVRREIAQLHGGGGEQLVERDRKRASLRQEQCFVPLSPVLDQRDVRVRRRSRFHPPTSTAKPPVSAAISRACASSRASPIAAPPPPAPVSFAHSAPAFRSAATDSSSSLMEPPNSSAQRCATARLTHI